MERIGKTLPPQVLTEWQRLLSGMTPEAFSGMVRMVRAMPADTLLEVGRVAQATPAFGPLELSVLQRAMRAVTVSFDGFDQEDLSRIAAEETDAEVLLDLVASYLLMDALQEKDPLAEAKLRGLEEQRRLLREAGGAVGATEAGKVLGGISRQAVDARRKKSRLLAVSTGRHGWRYPRCQFEEASEDKVVPGLDRGLAAIEDESGWMCLAFLLSPEERLGGERPLDALKAGEVARVERAARAYGEHVAS